MSEQHPLVDHNSVGRRIDHLAELHWIWSNGLGTLIQGTYHSEWEKDRIKDLESALKLLTNYMMLGYSDVEYARDINKMVQLSPEEKKFFGLPEDFTLPLLPDYKPNTEDIT